MVRYFPVSFVTNDSLLVCKVTRRELEHIKKLNELYSYALGQLLDVQKSFIFFRKNIVYDVRRSILDVMGIPNMGRVDKYLGLLALVGRTHIKAFIFVYERVKKRMVS